MTSTPGTGDTPKRPSLTLAEVVAKNVRNYRAIQHDGLTQAELAARLAPFGHNWTQATVSEVERNIRAVTVNELAALAVALDVSVAALLDPAGPERANERMLNLGGDRELPPTLALKFISDRWLDDEDARLVQSIAGQGSAS